MAFKMLILQEKIEYLVLWDGYPKEEASWVTEENVTSAAISYMYIYIKSYSKS